MKILQICPNPYHKERGGLYVTQKSCRTILNTKIVDTVPLNFTGDTEADYHIKQIEFLNFGNYGIPINSHTLISQLIKLDPDLIILHGIFQFNSVLAYYLWKIRTIPYVIFLHGTLDPYVFSYRSIPKYLWMYVIGKQILQEAKAVICTTSREAEKASQYLEKTNVEICPLGVEVPDLKKNSEWRHEIREKLGISPDKKILLFLGRIHPMKRPIETGLALKKRQSKDWIYLMIGNQTSSEKYRLESIVDNQKIYYHPPVYGLDKWKFMAAADAFVHLSYRENFGYSVAEAAAVGLPLLISDGVDIYPILQKSGAADVITINSINDIDKSIEKFLNKTESELREMGEKGKKVFQENFSWSCFEGKLFNLVQKYAKNR